jgi:hypothetical protein
MQPVASELGLCWKGENLEQDANNSAGMLRIGRNLQQVAIDFANPFANQLQRQQVVLIPR